MEGEEEKGKSQKEGKDMIQLDDETKFYNYIEKYLASNSEAKKFADFGQRFDYNYLKEQNNLEGLELRNVCAYQKKEEVKGHKGKFTYIGYWDKRTNAPQGMGLAHYPGKVLYEGHFTQGTVEGMANVKILNGAYRGTVKHGVRHGKGFFHNKGERYNGEYNMGRKHGHGRMVWPDGSIYDGHFDKDKCCGHGLLTWTDGRRYEGEFDNNRQNGTGRLTWPNGDMYVGEFRDGLMDGNGAMITAITGMRNEGIWTNGENVGWVEPEFSPEEAKRAMQIKDDPTLDVYVNLFLKQNEEAIRMIVNGEERFNYNHYNMTYNSILILRNAVKMPNAFFYIGYWNKTTGKPEGRGLMFKKGKYVYEGYFKNGKFEGKGLQKWDNRHIYAGEYQNGIKHGFGRYYWLDKEYTGEFRENKRNGNGLMLWKEDGSKYQGDWVNGLRTGKGILYHPDGKKYEGAWVDDIPHGVGKLISPDETYKKEKRKASSHAITEEETKNEDPDKDKPNTTSYKGQFANGERHGYGTISAAGSIYMGHWADNQRSGKGSMIRNDGIRYYGDWKKDFIVGKGILSKFHGKEYYCGEVFKGMKRGKGEMKWRNGKEYKGSWSADKPHGSGIMILPNGDKYVGGFLDGKREGKGKINFADNSRYVGEFKDDNYDGYGSYTYADGSTKEVKYIEGELVNIEEFEQD